MNNVFKNILKVCGVVGLVCLLTVLCCLPFVNFKDNKTVANAVELQPCDSNISSYTFTSSDILVPYSHFATYLDYTISTRTEFVNFSVSITFDSVTSSYSCSITFNGISYVTSEGFRVYGNNVGTYSVDLVVGQFNINWFTFHDSVHGDWYISAPVKIDTGFDCNVSRVSIFNQTDGSILGFTDGSVIEFYDSNNNMLRIEIPYSSSSFCSGFVPNRLSYLAQDLTDNDYYQSGIAYGKQLGRDEVWESRYNLGYDRGVEDGKAEGILIGISEENPYTFGNFFAGIINAPVGVFVSLFNFEIFGFNLLNLILGLLTLAVVCFIVKLLLGGK